MRLFAGPRSPSKAPYRRRCSPRLGHVDELVRSASTGARTSWAGSCKANGGARSAPTGDQSRPSSRSGRLLAQPRFVDDQRHAVEPMTTPRRSLNCSNSIVAISYIYARGCVAKLRLLLAVRSHRRRPVSAPIRLMKRRRLRDPAADTTTGRIRGGWRKAGSSLRRGASRP